jgi:chitinase
LGGGNNAPTVSITSPANGATFTAPATVSLAANASDSDGSVAKVAFYQNGALLGEDTSAPYTFTWSNVGVGSYTLTAVATDNQGATTTSSAVTITATTGGGNTPPVVSLTSPTHGATFTAPASVTLAATASDANGTVSKVEFFQGSTKLGEDTSSPYSYTWSGVTAGTYSITARATDNQNATTTSSAASITVSNPTGGCNAPQYVENNGYVAGSQVQNAGGVYQCREWPYSGWCNGAAWAYGPGTGTYWQDAWVFVSACGASTAAVQARVAEAESVAVYPNPGVTGRTATVTFGIGTSPSIATVEVKTLEGVGVYSQQYTLTGTTLDVEIPALPAGLYLIRLQHGAKSTTQRYLVK